MRRILFVLLALGLVAGLSFGAKDRIAEKGAEDRAEKMAYLSSRIPAVNATQGYWDTLAIATANLHLDDVTAFADGTIWIGGFEIGSNVDITLRSTNSGATWVKDSLTFNANAGYALAARNANIALAATWKGKIYRTTDGGDKWDSVYAYGGAVGFFNDIAFGGGDSVIAMGDADPSGLCVVKSTDAGATWTRYANLPAEEATPGKWSSSADYHQAIDVIGQNIWITEYFGSGTAPRLLRSTDFGATWTSAGLTLTGGLTQAYYVRSFNMADAKVGWLVPRATASGVRSFVHKTADGGATWSDTILVERGSVVKSVKPVKGTNNLLALGYTGNYPKAWWSMNGGASWTAIVPDTVGNASDLQNAMFVNPNLAYVVGVKKTLKFQVHDVTFQVKMNIKMRETGFQPGSGDIVRVAGSFNNWGGSTDTLTDANNDSIFTKTVSLPTGAIEYKFLKTLRAGLDWENVPNRTYTVVAGPQTIAAPYFDNDSVYTPPVPAGVTFRVNMKIKMLEQTFKPGSGDIVRVAGGFNNWGSSTDTLRDADNDSIYTKLITLNESQAIEYKYLKTTRSGDWESVDNRKYTVPVGGGSVPLVYFDNDSIYNAPVTVNFLWQITMSAYQTLGWFRPDLKDSIEVRGGFNGWAGTKLLPVTGQPGNYEAAVVYNGAIGDQLSYKYFMALDSVGATARFPGYVNSGTGATRDGFCYDHPSERGDGNRGFSVTGGGNTVVPRRWFSDIDARGLFLNTTDSCRVTLKVNLGPAKRYVDAFVPGADTVRLVWQDILWRSAQRTARGGVSGQFPDITMILAAGGGDSIYQATFTVKGKTHYNMQYTYRYIHPGGNAVDQGGGLGGQNPYITRFIQPVSPNTWPPTYSAPVDQWKKDAPLAGELAPWATGVAPEPEMGVPNEFALMQNYPNPFNPSTRIRYAIPAQANVTLKVFNLIGQEVAVLVNGEVQPRGNYVALFDAQKLATGVYFYRLEAGKFVEVKKMLLLK